MYNSFFPVDCLCERYKQHKDIISVLRPALDLVRLSFYDHLIFEVPHGIISLGCFLFACEKAKISWPTDERLKSLIDVPDNVKAQIDKVFGHLKKYDGNPPSRQLAEGALKKLRSLSMSGSSHVVQKQKEEFQKPLEKHPSQSHQQSSQTIQSTQQPAQQLTQDPRQQVQSDIVDEGGK